MATSSASLSLSIDSIFSTHHRLFPSSLPLHCKTQLTNNKTSFSIKSLSSENTTHLNTSFVDPISTHRIQTLHQFAHFHKFRHGFLTIQRMNSKDIERTVFLLAESFAESMFGEGRFVKLLQFLVMQYVNERRNLAPHTVMLVGFYKGVDMEEEELVCTAEISFDARGANAAPPTPLPPKNCPYICNMTVKKKFRRRGIGGELLKACEELISQMKTIRKIYLHCRMVDTVPFEMYKKAGYKVVAKDSFLVWLGLQRRKYLMCKDLPPLVDAFTDQSDVEEQSFQMIQEPQ